ncbi:MAG: phosphoribosylformylglycinamidine synthase I, phosphoribosylformylglycinamidine synthase [Candidatus Peregrinibacteria bacterium GW2011_GWE2_39_6]|nr:MAG: phosphoribosylformylglycinamidine synthase I, phosphoribosylformylglycinamidine synthase [Candidatus Peregrinibacteria bacterium GW2011_GWF2_39_17]KKR24383.1 MAG: phosphoribosylformylglycinamidine synthase I, phosphoribosylformylglycinamidine synthase [Candidatus Peregrinibacteria bacterium GW2011_GWE2_39_6]HCW31883.1 phosphoribosylformylglycinamidine synthase I [Candidatus Peregrinibacteria bacterium]
MKPKIALLYTEGINRDQESGYAFRLAGGETELVHVSELKSGAKKLANYQILFLPGGFANGDHLFSAKIWASESLAYFGDQLQAFAQDDKLIIGICNGFQCLIRTGLLPFNHLGKIEATLTHNASNSFQSRWVKLKIESSNCVFTRGLEGQIIRTPVSHGEGRFLAPEDELNKIEQEKQVVFRYVDEQENPTQIFPANPNGSTNAIAGLTSPNGKILGLMPHPECNTIWNHYPNWNEEKQRGGECLQLFKNAVTYF